MYIKEQTAPFSTSVISTSTISSNLITTTNNPYTTESSSSTSIQHLPPNLLHLLKKLFSFHDLNATVYLELLNSAYDLTECILNCSQSSLCNYDFIKNKFICASSASTQKGTSPCSTNRCLNNATCADSLNGTYTCKCDEHYEGKHCESKIDVCLQNACSSHSKCVDVSHRPKCKCFYLYEGGGLRSAFE